MWPPAHWVAGGGWAGDRNILAGLGWSPVFTLYSVPTYWVSSSVAATTQVNWGDTKVQQSAALHLCTSSSLLLLVNYEHFALQTIQQQPNWRQDTGTSSQ